VSLVVTCVQCRQEVLDAERIGDEEECALRDHLLAVDPKTLQPETLTVLLSTARAQRRCEGGGAGANRMRSSILCRNLGWTT
jgi:hypothetical protein